jgi:hypothetical protein
MRARIPLMIQDPTTTNIMGIKPKEDFFAEGEDFYYDGPITGRVAVLDFDETGNLLTGVPFVPKGSRLPHFNYIQIPKMSKGPRHISTFKKYFESARDFNQASVFGAILRTMYLFEDEYGIGRRVTWAFDSPQLLVVPRAGQWANAFYERESHSLQFFYFASAKDPKHTIFTSLSRDIVAHETAHAILDGIAPNLYDSQTPQSLALHEAIADLTAVFAAAKSNNLVLALLGRTGGAIKKSTIFASIAKEFGKGRDPEGKAEYLRKLLNDRTIKSVPIEEPHLLSEVLSGALFTVLVKLHEQYRNWFSREPQFKQAKNPMFTCSGKALAAATLRLRHTILPALDYLPPGDISFADYARAIMAVDQAAKLNKPEVSNWYKKEFINRGIVPNEKALEVETNFIYKPLQNVDFNSLVTDDKAARQFAEQNREFLHIPQKKSFKVLPRLKVQKTYRRVRGKGVKKGELIFKISWDHEENNPPGYSLPEKRAVPRGTTLVIDTDRRLVRFILTSDQSQEQCHNRNRMLIRLMEDDLLRLDHQGVGPDGKSLGSAVLGDTASGLLRIRGSARLLHISGQGK